VSSVLTIDRCFYTSQSLLHSSIPERLTVILCDPAFALGIGGNENDLRRRVSGQGTIPLTIKPKGADYGSVLRRRQCDSRLRAEEKYTGTTDRAEARRFKREFEDNLAKGALPTQKADWPVAQAAGLWVQHADVNLEASIRRSPESA
jgi:hypothetical protein